MSTSTAPSSLKAGRTNCRSFIRGLGRRAQASLPTLIRDCRGIMLLEAVVAVSVFALVGVAALAGVSTAHLTGERVEGQSIAENIARNQMENSFTQAYLSPPAQYTTLSVPEDYSVSATSSFHVAGEFDIAKVLVTVSRYGQDILTLETLRAKEPLENPDGFQLRVSDINDRSASTQLAGQTLSGTVYVFLDDPNLASNGVTFFFDGVEGQTEVLTPWDFKGGGGPGPTANPWDTTLEANGGHTITAQVTRFDATTFTLSSGILIGN